MGGSRDCGKAGWLGRWPVGRGRHVSWSLVLAVATAAPAAQRLVIPSPLAGQVFRPLLGELPPEDSGGLADFD